jgi:hypothetical protein
MCFLLNNSLIKRFLTKKNVLYIKLTNYSWNIQLWMKNELFVNLVTMVRCVYLVRCNRIISTGRETGDQGFLLSVSGGRHERIFFLASCFCFLMSEVTIVPFSPVPSSPLNSASLWPVWDCNAVQIGKSPYF